MTENNARRPFKKGDVVRVKPETKTGWDKWDFPPDKDCYVMEDETYYGKVTITNGRGLGCSVKGSGLELVTPVEKRDIYMACQTNHLSFHVYNVVTQHEVCDFHYEMGDYSKEEAGTLAQTEADRLNAKWRKEQNNG